MFDATVPETSVYKDRHLHPVEDKVRPTVEVRKRTMVDAVPQTLPVEHRP